MPDEHILLSQPRNLDEGFQHKLARKGLEKRIQAFLDANNARDSAFRTGNFGLRPYYARSNFETLWFPIAPDSFQDSLKSNPDTSEEEAAPINGRERVIIKTVGARHIEFRVPFRHAFGSKPSYIMDTLSMLRTWQEPVDTVNTPNVPAAPSFEHDGVAQPLELILFAYDETFTCRLKKLDITVNKWDPAQHRILSADVDVELVGSREGQEGFGRFVPLGKGSISDRDLSRALDSILIPVGNYMALRDAALDPKLLALEKLAGRTPSTESGIANSFLPGIQNQLNSFDGVVRQAVLDAFQQSGLPAF